MSVDVGIKLGVDGVSDFKSALDGVNSQIKSLNSEMKSVVISLNGMEDSEESAAKKTEILNNSVEASKQKISLLTKEYGKSKDKLNSLSDELEKAKNEFGENSKEAAKAENAYNRQVKTVNNLGRQLSDAKTDLSKFEQGLKDVGKVADDAADDIEGMGKELDDVSKASSGFGDILLGAFAGGAITSGIKAVANGISGLIESTSEYRKIIGTLEISSEKANYSAEQTEQTYKQLYGVLGDNQTAATATANLQALGLSQEQLTQITKGAIGAWATYGDSIPIDGLSEAINETVKAGKVTGTFADVLNWAGTSEDEFNEKLASATTDVERANIILDELAKQGLTSAADAWGENNKAILDANLANAELEKTMGAFGEILSPIATNAKSMFNELLGGALSLVKAFQDGGVESFIEEAANMVNGFVESFKENFPSVLESGREMILNIVQGITESLPSVFSKATELITGFVNFIKENLPSVLESGVEILNELITGIINSIPEMIKSLPKIILAITDFIKTAMPQIVKSGGDIVVNLVKGILLNLPHIIASLPELIETIVLGISDLMWAINDVGELIVEGLWEGISDMGQWLKGKIQGFCSTALDAIKDFFGIQSPSKVMEYEVGQMIGEGMAVGITQSKADVIKAMNSLNKAVLGAAQTDYSLQANITTGIDRATNSSLLKATESAINSMQINGGGQTVVIPIYLDGRQIAEATFNPLLNISKQRGVAFG